MITKNSGIYKITNKINNKIYIGKAFNLKKRMQDHSYAINKNYLCSAIKKYGWNNFEIEILQEYSEINNEILLALEAAFIDFYNSTNPEIGYNRCLFSNDKSGLPVLLQTKLKMSISKLGNKNNFFGKKHSEESKMNISNSHKGIITFVKSVKQIDKNTNQVIKIWNSIKEAAKSLEISDTNIVSMCRKNTNRKYPIKSVGGFKWEYA